MDTGIIRGHLGEVVGHGVRFDNADECMEGGALTLSYLRVGIVGAGYTFNLREHELENILQGRRDSAATEILRGDGAAG